MRNHIIKRYFISLKAVLMMLMVVIFVSPVASLSAKNVINKIEQYIQSHLRAIHEQEQMGKYSVALNIARQTYRELLALDLDEEAENLTFEIERLEEELLTLGSARILFDINGQPQPTLINLLKQLGIEKSILEKMSIKDINDWMQKNLLRKEERWVVQGDRFEETKSKIKALLEDLGFVKARSAHFNEYQGAIVHGALAPCVRLRLHYLVEQWNKGVRFTHLYFLSGERPLDPEIESAQVLIHDNDGLLKIRKDWQAPIRLPHTESEMIEMIWNQSDIPEDMRNKVCVHFIRVPMKKDGQGYLVRPNTDDTVEAWLKAAPPVGNYLNVSNAPYLNRQDLVVRTLSPERYKFDTIGPKIRKGEKMVVVLDELARSVFQTKLFLEK